MIRDARFDRAHLDARNRAQRRPPADLIVAAGCLAVQGAALALIAFLIVAAIAAALS